MGADEVNIFDAALYAYENDKNVVLFSIIPENHGSVNTIFKEYSDEKYGLRIIKIEPTPEGLCYLSFEILKVEHGGVDFIEELAGVGELRALKRVFNSQSAAEYLQNNKYLNTYLKHNN